MLDFEFFQTLKIILACIRNTSGMHGSVVIEALCYELEGRGFEAP
jgi:hypothetical protein